MKNMSFSKRIVLVYSIIVIGPLFLLISAITYSLISKEESRIVQEEVNLLNESCKKVEEAINTIDLVESIILSDTELTLFLARPESISENELINTILTKASYMEQVCEITPDIYAIRIFPKNTRIPERWPVFLSSKRIENEPHKRWNYDYQASYLGNQKSLQLPSFCTTRQINKGIKETGFIQIAYRMETIFPFLYEEENTNSAYLILNRSDSDGHFEIVKKSLSYNEKTLSERQTIIVKQKILQTPEENGKITFGNLKKQVCWQYIPNIDSYIVKITSLIEFRNRFIVIVFVVFIAFVITSIALYFVIRYASTKLLSGIYSLMDGMKRVKEGNISIQIAVDGIDEVSETQSIFNSMTQQLTSQIQQIKDEQSLIAETEMKAMQNQINAHFLYNVLETIRMQAVLADEEEISDSLQILGRMMRYCLRWRVHRVSLAQEIDYIRSYIYILNVRNDYVITLDLQIDESLMEVEIPKMTLQPLIENAFVHAIEKEEKDATLRVYSQISPDKSRIVLSVQDFGCGMTQEQVDNLNVYLKNDTYEKEVNKGSIGLKNIQQRLTVFYGPDYRIEIKSKLGEGTTISVPIPFKELKREV
ncbi:MAG: histidine kinase [Treponema sp.]|nr:histidine kinase [Treponema sp.]